MTEDELEQKRHELVCLREELRKIILTHVDSMHSRASCLVAINACLQLALRMAMEINNFDADKSLELVSSTVNLIMTKPPNDS